MNFKRGKLNISSDSTQKPAISCRHFVVAPCVLLHIFAYMLTGISLNQYVVYSIHKMRYPNDTSLNVTSGNEAPCEKHNISTAQDRKQAAIQEEAALWNIYNSVATCLPAVISNLIFGTYMDKFGRKLLFLTALVGTFLKCLGLTLGMVFNLNIYVFILFNVFEGITGMWVGTLSAAFSYIADITESGKNRSFAITLMEMVMGLGAFLGSLISGYIIQSLGYIYTVVIPGACVLTSIVLVIFILPETKKKNKSLSVGIFRNMKTALSFYFQKKANNNARRWKYNVCLGVFTLLIAATIGNNSVRILYVLNSPFCWKSVKIGWYGGISSMSHQIIGISTIKLLQCCFSDITIALFGALSNLAGLIYTGLASTDLDLYLVVAVAYGSMMTMPMIRGIMSKMTDAEKQGSMFAGLAAMESVTNLVGHLAANAVYKATLAVYRGIVFFFLSGFVVLAIVLIVIFLIGTKASDTDINSNDIDIEDTSTKHKNGDIKQEISEPHVDIAHPGEFNVLSVKHLNTDF